MHRMLPAVIVFVLLALCASAGVRVAFDPSRPEVGPFPTDFLTVPDATQKTGLRVNLPASDCAAADPASCQEIALLNLMDGFSLFPRLKIHFSGPIEPDTLRAGVFIVWLDKLANDEWGLYAPGQVTPINEVLWDPKTNAAYAKPDYVLGQTRRFAVFITDRVHDKAGAPVEADPGFAACLARTVGGGYCDSLSAAAATYESRLGAGRIVGGSIFTTLSATTYMEKARDQLQTLPAQARMASPKSTFDVAALQSLTVRLETNVNPSQFADQPLPLAGLAGVGRIAFGSFQSPLILNQQLMVPPLPTAAPLSLPAVAQELQFEVFLPATPAPANGYPVLMVGHPMPNNRFGLPFGLAATMAANGIATIAFNLFGSGMGPDGKVVLTGKDGLSNEIPFGGRSIDVNGDNAFDPLQEGCVGIRFLSDCGAQSAVDFLQLARVIQAGIDVDGDGKPDLDRANVFYTGVSIGAMVGTIVHSLDPTIQAAVINSPPGVNAFYWIKSLRPAVIGWLQVVHPSLLNKGNDYDADYVLRYQPAKTITVDGAVDLQEWYERLEWLGMTTNPVAWAPHLAWTTLSGVPVKRTMFQISMGDGAVSTPSLSAVVRSANMRTMTSLYRHDLAVATWPELAQIDPHYMLLPMSPASQIPIAMAEQQQLASFLLSGAWTVPDVPASLRTYFELPPAFLPEILGW